MAFVEYSSASVALKERDANNSRGVLVSLVFHAGAILLVFSLSALMYRSEQFKQPPTFTLVTMPPVMPEPLAPQPAQEQVKKVSVRQPAAPVPAATEQPKAQETVPNVSETNPVPSQEPVAQPVASSGSDHGTPAQSSGIAGDADQPIAIGSATTVLDNTSFAPIFNPKPAYPAIAFKANIQGYVDLELVVTPAGTVESFEILKVLGHPSFGVEIIKVIRRWRFPPPRINGKSAKIKYNYRVNFTLD
jgi:protein TonB